MKTGRLILVAILAFTVLAVYGCSKTESKSEATARKVEPKSDLTGREVEAIPPPPPTQAERASETSCRARAASHQNAITSIEALYYCTNHIPSHCGTRRNLRLLSDKYGCVGWEVEE